MSRDELLTLPEFVLLSLFPNGLLPDGHVNSYHEDNVYPVDVSKPITTQNSTVAQATNNASMTAQQITALISNSEVYLSDSVYQSSQYDPTSLQYMLEFFRNVAQTIPQSADHDTTSQQDPSAPSTMPIEPMPGNARDMLQDRAGIIVLREDLDFYAIPPRKDIEQHEMIEVKRAAGRALQKQNGIFSGLRKSEEPGTTEQHLIEMLTAGYVHSHFQSSISLADHLAEASTTPTTGATGPQSPTRPLSAQLLSHDYGQTSAASRPIATPSAWRRSCSFSGASQPGDAGGRASSWRTSRVWKAS